MTIQFKIKAFDDLTNVELYEILKLRQEVFVVEQTCVFLDADGYDERAIHVLGIAPNNDLAAYIRIFRPNDYYPEASIGRVAVAKNYRGTGLGYDLMNVGIQYCQSHFPAAAIKIGAQMYLDKFYKSLGFVPCSDMYLEDGIEHQYMQLQKA